MTGPMSFDVHLAVDYDQALEQVRQALKEEGFGVLTFIDVSATLKEKTGEEFRPYAILGACNPPLAHRALSAEPLVGLMLPCNVTVEAAPEGGALVRIANPETLMETGALSANQALQQVAAQARQKLERVAEQLRQGA